MICADAPDADTRQKSNAHTLGLKLFTVTTSILSSVIGIPENILILQHSGFPHRGTVAQLYDGDSQTAVGRTLLI
jgi:hypothetical protein